MRLRGRRVLPLALVAAVTVAVYGRALPRYFVSEDFTLLGFLAQRSFWANAWIHLTEPLLGITFVPFYRPFSTMVLDLERHVWGTWPAGFALTHLLVHLGNAALLQRIAFRISGGNAAVALATALLFAVYPLHPNSVLFIGSFATLFSAAAGLGALWLFLRFRRRGRVGTLAGAGACFAFALGSYEAAAVLPALVVLSDALGPETPRLWPGWRGACARHAPFFVVLAGYLALRQAVLRSPGAVDLAAGLGFDWARFVVPTFDAPRPEIVPRIAAVLVAAGALLSLAVLAGSRRSPRAAARAGEARLYLLAVAWILLAQWPFHDPHVVPATGRFWYLSSAALGLLLAAVVRTLTPRRWRDAAVIVAALALAAGYVRWLHGDLGVYLEAGRTTKAIQAGIEALAEASDPAPGPRIFLTGAPSHLTNRRGTPVAQVFHWGLSDALRPPFTARDRRVYPLPPVSDERLVPLLDRPDLGRVLRWTEGRLEPVPREAARPGLEIRVLSPEDGELPDDGTVRFVAPPADKLALVVVARGNQVMRAIRAAPASDRLVEARWTPKFVESMQRLYPDDLYWWIEALDRRDRPVAFSPLRTVDRAPAGPAEDRERR